MAIDLNNDSLIERNKRFLEENKVRDETELVVSDEAGSISYVDRYTNSNTNANEEKTITREEAERRISKVSDRMEIFLYDLLPYEALGLVNSLGISSNGFNKPNAFSIASSAITSLEGLTKLKYFTPAELSLTLSHNFYTLHYLRGITAKKGSSELFGRPSDSDGIWNGDVDLYYGRGPEQNVAGAATAFFGGLRDINENANNDAAALKNNITPKIDIGDGYIKITKKQSFVDQLSDANIMSPTERSELFLTILRDQADAGNGKWSNEEAQLTYSVNSQMNRKHETNADEYIINEKIKNIIQRVNDASNGKWTGKDDESTVITETFDFNQAKNRNHSKNSNDYLINENTLDVTQRINDVDNVKNGKWISRNSEGNIQEETFELRDVEYRNHEKDSNEYLINPNVIKIKLRSNPVDDRDSGSITEELLKEKGFIKTNNGRWQIGAMYVMPVVATQYIDYLPRFYIPFEFNPQINENGIEARYQQVEILSRIGNLQTYTGTNSLSVSLTTNYYAVSHDETLSDTNGQGWMSEFTLPRLQAIELGYRSLVYPHYPDTQEINQGYKYVKPPLLKVIVGDYQNAVSPYANILTYQTDTVTKNRLQTSENYGGKILRTFIATNVSIKKDLMETPIFLDENRTIRDTFGFEVNLSLIEVTPNYQDSFPDFNNYFQQYSTVMGDYINKDNGYGQIEI